MERWYMFHMTSLLTGDFIRKKQMIQMKTYTKDFNQFYINENQDLDHMKKESIGDAFAELIKMLHRCVLHAEKVNAMTYDLEDPTSVMLDDRVVGEKLKQVWAALTTGDARDTSKLDEIFK